MAVDWLSADELGLVKPDYSRLEARADPIRGVVVHWIDNVPEPHQPAAVWRELQRAAMDGENVNHTFYGDIEYNAGVCESVAHPGNGTILVGRDNDYVGAHALSEGNVANRTTLGVAVLGNALTPGVVQALLAYLYVVRVAEVAHGTPFVLEGHRELAPIGGISTVCPGAFGEWTIRQRSACGGVLLAGT